MGLSAISISLILCWFITQSDKDNFHENQRIETYQGGPRSPPYEDTYERRSNDRSGRPPIINDWRRENRFGDGRRISDGEYKPEGQSPERSKDLGSSSPPVVRPVREILGENVLPLRISEPPKASGKASDGSAVTQVKLLSMIFHVL